MVDNGGPMDSVAVVLRGNFNPAIVTPTWLLAEELLGKEDATAANVEVLVPQVAAFSLPWARVEVTEDRFAVTTVDAQAFERVRDLVFGTFSHLGHTPVSALGINRSFHCEAASYDEWHALGDRLVPKDPWEQFMALPGVASLLVQGTRPDTYGGQVSVRFEPSTRVRNGVYLEHNDHYSLKVGVEQPKDRAAAESALGEASVPSSELLRVALKILMSDWENSMLRAETMRSKIGRGSLK